MMIRPTIEEDLKDLMSIIASTNLFPPELLPPMLSGYLSAGGDGSLWLTLCDLDPVGVVYCVPEMMTMGTWNMLLLAIHSDYQHAGRGAKLVSFLEDKLREIKARLLIVETSGVAEFERTRQFYRKMGYIEAARIPDFYSRGDDKLTFFKAI